MRVVAILVAVMLAACSTPAPKAPPAPGHDYERQHRESEKAFEELGRDDMRLEAPAAGRRAPRAPAPRAQGAGIPRGGPMPVWVRDPHYDGLIGAVGIAPPQGARGGIRAQREAAVLLAQAKLAEQLKVLVRSQTELVRIVHDDGRRQAYQHWLSKLSVHEAEAAAQRAEVREQWMDDRGNLYVRLVLLPPEG
ncbi:MAG: hypothetical protein D6771_00130 [Zetaproteobacteria bacterium]|nr:MAG: hypothetical protein D6771_00130 [Zetaproteobacteria bacterium]